MWKPAPAPLGADSWACQVRVGARASVASVAPHTISILYFCHLTVSVTQKRGDRSYREPEPPKEEAEASPGSEKHRDQSKVSSARASSSSMATTGDLAVLVLQQGHGEGLVDMLFMRKAERELLIFLALKRR